MDRETLRTLTIALLAVVVTALAASAFTGAVTAGPLEDFGLGNADDTQTPGDADTSGGLIGGQAAETVLGTSIICIQHPYFVYGVPLLVFGGVIYLFDRFNSWIAGRLSAGFGLLIGIPYAVLISCPSNDAVLAASTDFGELFARAGTDIPTPVPVDPLLLMGALVVGVVGVVVAVQRLSLGRTEGRGREFHVDLLPRPANPQTDLAGVADVAGSAADRLDEDVDVDNEVYRAWREMTAYLDVEEPASSTPREFEAAAVEAGLDPADVAALTTVFEAVRYGDVDPESRAGEAAAALRRIEAAADAVGDHRDW